MSSPRRVRRRASNTIPTRPRRRNRTFVLRPDGWGRFARRRSAKDDEAVERDRRSAWVGDLDRVRPGGERAADIDGVALDRGCRVKRWGCAAGSADPGVEADPDR